jgi:hypothetical protein
MYAGAVNISSRYVQNSHSRARIMMSLWKYRREICCCCTCFAEVYRKRFMYATKSCKIVCRLFTKKGKDRIAATLYFYLARHFTVGYPAVPSHQFVHIAQTLRPFALDK